MGRKTALVLAVLATVLAVAFAAQAQEKKKSPPRGRTQITFEVTPPTTIVYVDNKKHGEASKLTTIGVAVSAGTHSIRLVNGGDEMEADVQVKAGQSLNFRYVFEDSGAGSTPKDDKKKDAGEPKKDKKEKKGEAGKDKAASKDAEKKKDEVIDLPPDKTPGSEEPEKKDEGAKPWKKGTENESEEKTE